MEYEIAKKAAESRTPDLAAPPTSTTQGSINWNEYNFPPFLRLVHFRLDELQGPVKRFVLNAYASFMIVVSVLLINSKLPLRLISVP